MLLNQTLSVFIRTSQHLQDFQKDFSYLKEEEIIMITNLELQYSNAENTEDKNAPMHCFNAFLICKNGSLITCHNWCIASMHFSYVKMEA